MHFAFTSHLDLISCIQAVVLSALFFRGSTSPPWCTVHRTQCASSSTYSQGDRDFCSSARIPRSPQSSTSQKRCIMIQHDQSQGTLDMLYLDFLAFPALFRPRFLISAVAASKGRVRNTYLFFTTRPVAICPHCTPQSSPWAIQNAVESHEGVKAVYQQEDMMMQARVSKTIYGACSCINIRAGEREGSRGYPQ